MLLASIISEDHKYSLLGFQADKFIYTRQLGFIHAMGWDLLVGLKSPFFADFWKTLLVVYMHKKKRYHSLCSWHSLAQRIHSSGLWLVLTTLPLLMLSWYVLL